LTELPISKSAVPLAGKPSRASASDRSNPLPAPFLIKVETLDDLRRLPPPRLAPARVRVELALPGLADDERRTFEKRLTDELAACGCSESSIALLIYFITAGALVWFGPLAPGSWLGWVALVLGMALASMAGKIAGLVHANVRLRRIAAEVMRAVQVQGDG